MARPAAVVLVALVLLGAALKADAWGLSWGKTVAAPDPSPLPRGDIESETVKFNGDFDDNAVGSLDGVSASDPTSGPSTKSKVSDVPLSLTIPEPSSPMSEADDVQPSQAPPREAETKAEMLPIPLAFVDPNSPTCMSTEFMCHSDRKCIPDVKSCDRNYDCDDGSDEYECSNSDDKSSSCSNGQMFKCRDGSCIALSQRCNDVPECPEGEDEDDDVCPSEDDEPSEREQVGGEQPDLPPLPEVPRQSPQPRERARPQSSEVQIVRMREGENWYPSCPTDNWMRPDGQPLRLGHIILPTSLWLPNLQLSDSGIYRCKVDATTVRDYELIVVSRSSSMDRQPGQGGEVEDIRQRGQEGGSRNLDPNQANPDRSWKRQPEQPRPHVERMTKKEGEFFQYRCPSEMTRSDGAELSRKALVSIHGLYLPDLTTADTGRYRCNQADGTATDIELIVMPNRQDPQAARERAYPPMPSRLDPQAVRESAYQPMPGRLDPQAARERDYQPMPGRLVPQEVRERAYPPIPCEPSTEFTCRSDYQCIPRRSYCDGRADCRDSSDEYECPNVRQPQPEYNREPERSFDDAPENIDLQAPDTPQNVSLNQDVVFRCRDRSKNRATVYWTRENGRPLQPKATVNSTDTRLSILKAQPEDSGTYECHVREDPRMVKLNFLNVKPTADFDVGPVGPWPPAPVYPPYVPRPVPPPEEMNEDCLGPSRIACRNGKCIDRSNVCNGRVDCADSSDEASCPRRCSSGQFRCDNNHCVSRNMYCNGRSDCEDQSDERGCKADYLKGQCGPYEFRCTSGQSLDRRRKCIPWDYVCDKFNDCEDGSDESRCRSPTMITVSSSSLEAARGSTVILTCKATGYPRPRLTWRHNMDYLPISWPRATVCSTSESTTEAHSVLTITEFDDTVTGPWTCEASNAGNFTLADYDIKISLIGN